MQNTNVPKKVAFSGGNSDKQPVVTKTLKIKNKPKELTPEQKKETDGSSAGRSCSKNN